MQVLYLGRTPRTKETLPDFHEKCRVTQHSLVFRGLTGIQRTPGFGGVTEREERKREREERRREMEEKKRKGKKKRGEEKGGREEKERGKGRSVGQ